jgi:hypothetical protein
MAATVQMAPTSLAVQIAARAFSDTFITIKKQTS